VTRPVAPQSVILPQPPDRYDARDQRETRRLVELAFQRAMPARVVVTGAKGGNAALTSLIEALESLGLIDDQTS
jgi:hypothetical protein